MAINGTAVGVAAVGVVLAYSGIKGKTITNTVRYIISGKNPADAPDESGSGNAIGGEIAPPTGGVAIGGNQYNYVISSLRKQFPRAATAGIAGNIQIESGFDPNAFNVSEGAIGFCQWEGGRRTALQAYASLRGLKETDPQAQMGYLFTELSTAFAPVRLQLMRPGITAAEAATIFDAQYEISSGSARAQRIAAADSIYASIS